ncbi:uncharacterized protein LOC129809144, partial [Phlebotomus papatasi]|uniref:uncharacterized protein LOC129809144 n=1 Tax=Phlebotomus papatasi TaxID=29031 RepID=UPI002483CA68
MSGGNLKVVIELLAQEKSEIELLNFLFKDKNVMELVDMLAKGDEVLSAAILTKMKSDMEQGLELQISDKKKLVKNLCGQPMTERLTELLNEILFFTKGNNQHVQTGGGNIDDNILEAGISHNMTEQGATNGALETVAVEDVAETNTEERESSEPFEEDLVKFLQKTKSFSKRFNTTQVELSFQLKCPTSDTCMDWLEKAFSKVIATVQAEGNPGDKVIFEICLKGDSTNKPIFLGLRPLGSLTADAVFAAMEKVHQSTTVFSEADVLSVRAYLIHQMVGRGKRHYPGRMNLAEMRRFKQKSIIDISGTSNCLPTSLFVDSNCTNCSPVEHVFESDSSGSAVAKFLDYVLTFRPMPTVAIAHNAKGYDGQFILEELCQREEKIEPVLQGCKILFAKVKGVTFLDSLSFIPFPLSQFSKSFGLPECDKGYYPYKFNTMENRSYIGPYPPIEMYPIESMTSQQYTEFLEWYEQVKELPFDNRKELIHYCRQDVKILMMGCLNFMHSFIETTSLNPFLQAITIADAVMKAYRKNYLTPNTLAITPKNNYNSNFLQMQSKISLKWLVYMKETSHPNIKYEVKIRGSRYIADGYDEASNTVYSFEGCFFHGHTCFLNRGHAFSKKPNDNMQSRYEATLKRLDHIRQLGYNLVSIWECEFRRMLESDPVLAERLNNHPEVVDSGFDLRSAVYGGRTEVFRTYYKCRPGDKIYYYDFTSLYPWANKYSKYFVGHPKIIKDIPSQEEVLKHDGVVKCTILPPKGLYIPCLPFRCNNRLFFPLCRKCAEDLNTDRCLHSDDERSLTGIWSIDEVRLAIDHGYVITKCFEVWSYRTSQYNRETGERGLFADYVDNFLKIKQEASGWPPGVESESDKDNYIREFFENEGIQLDKENIRVNK